MAAKPTTYGQLDQLQPGKDKIEEYHQRFLLYCTANEITDADKMKAIFLTSVGGVTYALLANLESSQATGAEPGATDQIVEGPPRTKENRDRRTIQIL